VVGDVIEQRARADAGVAAQHDDTALSGQSVTNSRSSESHSALRPSSFIHDLLSIL
jgi:hypothetical protein